MTRTDFIVAPATEAEQLAARMAGHLAVIMPTEHATERAAHVATILLFDELDASPREIATAVCVHARRPHSGGARYVSETATVGQIHAALDAVADEWERHQWSELMSAPEMLGNGGSHQGAGR